MIVKKIYEPIQDVVEQELSGIYLRKNGARETICINGCIVMHREGDDFTIYTDSTYSREFYEHHKKFFDNNEDYDMVCSIDISEINFTYIKNLPKRKRFTTKDMWRLRSFFRDYVDDLSDNFFENN